MIYSEREQSEFIKFFQDELKDKRGEFILHSLRNAITLVTEERYGGGRIQIEIPLHPAILENIHTNLSVEEVTKRKSESFHTQFLFQYNDYLTLFRFKPYKIDEKHGFIGDYGYNYIMKDKLLSKNYSSVESLISLRKGKYFKAYYDTFSVRKYLIDFLSIRSFNYFLDYEEPSTKVIQKNNSLIFVILPKEPLDYKRAY